MTNNPLIITVNDNTTVTARFVRIAPVLGCTDPAATNYNSSATSNDGSCIYPTWRSCLDGSIKNGTAPSDYKEVPYLGAAGGMCWEPIANVGFTPGLNSVVYSYQRSSSTYPIPQNFTAQNPSYSLSYRVKLTTNNTYFTISPSEFTVPPRESRPFTITVNNAKLNEFADGQTRFDLSVEITQI